MCWAFGMIFLGVMEKEHALGLLFVGMMPGGSTSNLFCYYGQGDVALSIIMTIFSTFSALFMIPICMAIYSGSFTTDSTQTSFVEIIKALLIVIIPASIGLLINNFDTCCRKNTNVDEDKGIEMKGQDNEGGDEKLETNPSPAVEDDGLDNPKWADRTGCRKCAKVLEIVATALGVLFIVGALYIGIKENPDIFETNWAVYFCAILMQWFGTIFGILSTMCFFKCYEKRGKEVMSYTRKTMITKAVSMETGM